MAKATKQKPTRTVERSIDAEVRAALAALKQKRTRRDRDNLKRFGITAPKAFGVSMANIQLLAKRLGRSHELAGALWDTGCEAQAYLTAATLRSVRTTRVVGCPSSPTIARTR